MSVEIFKDDIQQPAQNNLTWIFPVRLNGKIVPWKVDSFDLNLWFKEAVGRYPMSERGDSDTRKDIHENWDKFEPFLRRELEKEASLPMKISIEGERTAAEDWEWAQSLAEDELPPLNDLQRKAAEHLHIPEIDYRRARAAAQKSLTGLLRDTEHVGVYLQQQLRRVANTAVITAIKLDLQAAVFAVQVRVDAREIPVRVNEDLVNRILQTGSRDAENELRHVLEIATETYSVQ